MPYIVLLFQRRNRKHLLMLRCLATNDLVALLGMLVQMYVTIYVGSVTSTRVFCSLRVVWRLFGLFSGCVAIVMAVERWLALTRPFVYQKVSSAPEVTVASISKRLVSQSREKTAVIHNFLSSTQTDLPRIFKFTFLFSKKDTALCFFLFLDTHILFSFERGCSDFL